MKRASFSSPDDAFTAAHSRQGFAHAAPEKRRALDRCGPPRNRSTMEEKEEKRSLFSGFHWIASGKRKPGCRHRST
jgi:hypothetical protein